jgi:hypothetical protein
MTKFVYEYALCHDDRIRLIRTAETNRRVIYEALLKTHRRQLEYLEFKRTAKGNDVLIPPLGDGAITRSWDQVIERILGRRQVSKA